MPAGRYQGRPADEGWAAKGTKRGSMFVYASRTHLGSMMRGTVQARRDGVWKVEDLVVNTQGRC